MAMVVMPAITVIMKPVRIVDGLGLGIAAGLVLLAGLFLTAALDLAPAAPALDRLTRGQSISMPAARHLQQTADAATRRVPSSRAWHALALAHMAAKSPAAAAHALKQALSTGPGDAYGWARLAYLHLILDQPAKAAIALTRSYRLGPWERPLLSDRLPLAAHLWERLEPALQQQALNDLATAWSWQRGALLTALPPDHYWPLYRRALATDPAALKWAARRVWPD